MDIREIIDHGPMTGLQLRAVSFCFFLNMLDGVDVLSISFAAPLLSREWGIDSKTLGVVFSAALAGMVAGHTLLAPLGDVMGRRKVLAFSLLLIAIGMLGVVFAGSLTSLLVLRFVTGCGLGGVVPTMATFAAELSPARRRNFAVTAVSVGNPHAVVRGDPNDLPLIGPLLETHPRFPERTNVQVARLDGPGRIVARVWERGAGETSSSGTSAVAVAAALGQERADVTFPGGTLHVRFEGCRAFLTGPAERL